VEIKPLYSLAEVAPLERCAPGTLRNRIRREHALPVSEQRYPNYERGCIPLADLKRRFGLTTDELRELTVPNGDTPNGDK
jgi:hypothetical protein